MQSQLQSPAAIPSSQRSNGDNLQTQDDGAELLPVVLPTPPGGLKERNPHERDSHIEFFDVGHIYDVDGRRDFVSCTTLVHQFCPEFDADLVIGKMMGNAAKWKRSPYFGMTPADIKAQWKRKGDVASHNGTILHGCIEFFYNDWQAHFPYDTPPEFDSHFVTFEQKVVAVMGYIPYRTEWCVFDEDHELAGSIDMTYQVDANDPDTLVIYDWKRSCKLKNKTNPFQSMGSPLDHLPDTAYWHYAMQLNVYRHILETKYNKKIVGMYLVGIHPDLDGFRQERVPLLTEETNCIFALRKETLSARLPT
jgi:hypothetical protein